ncbi:B-box zinc finger protein 20 [Platanthera guangdongensis]|uniref:B-box zinc finger protein 20 n=1 Tax=Platanthera guangdongensis TaxID=2320717 RepID=A0ABR2N390_9ASPA
MPPSRRTKGRGAEGITPPSRPPRSGDQRAAEPGGLARASGANRGAGSHVVAGPRLKTICHYRSPLPDPLRLSRRIAGACSHATKLQCDVCGVEPASVLCCADEAVLCTVFDARIHSANKLAGKHRRFSLQF